MAKKKTQQKPAVEASKQKTTLIISDEKSPAVALKKGMRLEVVSVSLVGPNLKKPSAVAARLCGGTSTCLALVEFPDDSNQ